MPTQQPEKDSIFMDPFLIKFDKNISAMEVCHAMLVWIFCPF